MGYWSVPRIWAGATVFCVASGPSLRAEDVARLRGFRVITINGKINDEQGAILNCPFADVLYAADTAWWRKANGAPKFHGMKVAVNSNHEKDADAYFPAVRVLRHSLEPGLSSDPAILCSGHNSGYQAINLAILFGGVRVILLGYDAQPTNGRAHHHGNHPPGLSNPTEWSYRDWLLAYANLPDAAARLGAVVLNASRETAITSIPRVSLEDVL